jgi:predicted O-linked N-acetylglucosamine transferase (SPINDLY family)
MTDIFQIAREHFLSGLNYFSLDKFYEAEYEFIKSLEHIPNRISTLTNLSSTQIKLKKYSEASLNAHKAINYDPENKEAYLNLGLIENKRNNFLIAITYFNQSLALEPNYAEAFLNKGVTLHECKHYEEAITCFDKALIINPEYAEALSNKGITLGTCKRYEEAIACFDEALVINPNYGDAHFNRGILFDELGYLEEAITCYKKAIAYSPLIDWAQGNLLFTMLKICCWYSFDDDLYNITSNVTKNAPVTTPFPMLSFTDNPAIQKKCSEIYINERYPAIFQFDQFSYKSNKKIRIGYFSSDFQNHPVAYLTSEVFELHDRNQFEIYAFSLREIRNINGDDQRLNKIFDKFVDVASYSDLEIAKLVKSLSIDIAIDLNGHTQHARIGIFAYRIAPIQITWLGYAGTLGAKFIDYIIADRVVIPESDFSFYTEKVIHLPNTYIVDDSRRLCSAKIFKRDECGLPENAFIFCCFNNSYKFNKKVLDSWSRILLEVNNSFFWISENNASFRKNLTNEFKERGIDVNRLIFAKKLDEMGDYLARFALADIFLDTFPYGAHTTALDSLKCGVPIITKIGLSFASRVASSILTAIELPDLIADSQKEYEELAIYLAKNPYKLQTIKENLMLKRTSSPLFNTTLFTKDLEKAYVNVYKRYQMNLSPDHLLFK